MADFLDRVLVRQQMQREVKTLRGALPIAEARARLRAEPLHQSFPVVDDEGLLIGVVMRREVLDEESGASQVKDLVRRPPAVAYEDNSLREAADHLLRENVGRLPVVRREAPRKMVGFLTRSDILAAHARRLHEVRLDSPGLALHGTGLLKRRKRS